MHQHTNEEWRDVLGWEGQYQVSDHGRVRSVDRLVVTKAGHTERRRGKVLRLHRNRDGYMVATLCRAGTRRTVKVHRLVLEAFVGPCPDSMIACHDNGDPADNRPDTLRWATYSANMHDSVKHGSHHAARKTHCPRGHLLEAPNLVDGALKRGQRTCKACQRAHARVARRPELRPDLQQVADDYYRAITSPDG